ncbi:MAG: PHB depolymerase family esterase [Pseudomonadota bacterium]
MTRKYLFVLAAALLSASAPADDAAPWTTYSINPDRISVSGISSGGYMASQLHVAYSELMGGLGLIAAGPWGCSRANLLRALGPCVKGGELDVAPDVEKSRSLAAAGSIDDVAALKDDHIWLFHGTEDAAIGRSVVAGAEAFYRALAPTADIVVEDSVPAAHGLPTVDKGAGCSEFVSPYLNACGYDLAGELLRHVTDQADAKPGGGAAALREVDLTQALTPAQLEAAHLLPSAFLYVPEHCAEQACGVHVMLHGCQQSSEKIGNQLAQNGGFNRWADSLSLIVLYPQVRSSAVNPLGCWDWWGYTGPDYLLKDAPQIKALRDLIAGLSQ